MTEAQQSDLTELFPPVDVDGEEERIALHLLPAVEALQPGRELVASMERRGQLQPIILNDQPDGYRVIDGRRRLAAARALGWTDVRARVLKVDGLAEAAIAVTANAVRGDNPLSDLEAILKLDQAGYSEREIAQATGLRVATIRKRVKLRKLPAGILDAVLEGKVAMGVAEKATALNGGQLDRLLASYEEAGRLTGDDVAEATKVIQARELALITSKIPVELFAAPAAPAPEEQLKAELRDVIGRYRQLDRLVVLSILEEVWADDTAG